jgi:hypothetical protein
MKKGSPQDYTAEIGCSQQPTQKSRLGEPHECYSLYRIRRTQENYQLLRKDGRRPDCGRRHMEAQRTVLRRWAEGRRKQAWHGAMEATLFSAWIYDTLKPYAQQLSMGHPARMKAITAGKKKSDPSMHVRLPICCVATCLPTCYVLPPQLRDLRRLLRYRNLVVQQSVRMQNKMAGLLMESGTAFNKDKAARKKYFSEPDEEPGGSTGIGQRSAADESRLYGDVRVHPEAARQRLLRNLPWSNASNG